jgi:prepilin-type N-terminal cleavage/methylation domain-containing protein
MKSKRGITLIETIVCIAILSILVAILLPAIQSARLSSSKLQSTNNLKQLATAFQNFAITQTKIPGYPIELAMSGIGEDKMLFVELRPQLELAIDNEKPIRILRSPGDPTIAEFWHPDLPLQVSSYSANMQCLLGNLYFPSSFRDGLSQTILFAERYAVTINQFYASQSVPASVVNTANSLISLKRRDGQPPTKSDIPLINRRATFTDRMFADVYPITNPSTRITLASDPGVTFELMPYLQQASPFVLQSPYPSGLPVAMMDGSVRTIHPQVSERSYWAMMTPAAGDVATEH